MDLKWYLSITKFRYSLTSGENSYSYNLSLYSQCGHIRPYSLTQSFQFFCQSLVPIWSLLDSFGPYSEKFTLVLSIIFYDYFKSRVCLVALAALCMKMYGGWSDGRSEGWSGSRSFKVSSKLVKIQIKTITMHSKQ